jgi:hypothetical protein
MSDTGNKILSNLLDILYSLSFYAPLIICISMIVLSVFTSSWAKLGFYFLWIFVITCLRVLVFKGIGNNNNENLPEKCLTGIMFIPQDITYSTYILSFTLMYLLMPMIILTNQTKINVINYSVLGFFIFYIVFDIGIKYTLSCITSLSTGLILCDIISGLFLGGIISGPLMFGTNLKKYLYINEMNSNKEVCSLPSKQQFKCKLFRNGELVGNI